MSPKQRWIILGSLLGATLLATYLVDDEPVPDKPKRKASTASRSAGSAAGEARRTERNAAAGEPAGLPLSFPEPVPTGQEGERKVIDPFRSHTWYVAPPPPPPARPTAPPLPFQYLGKLKEDDGTRVFLNQQGKHIIAKVGDVIDGTYSVEDISGGQMTLLYLPLKEKQMLAIGADK